MPKYYSIFCPNFQIFVPCKISFTTYMGQKSRIQSNKTFAILVLSGRMWSHDRYQILCPYTCYYTVHIPNSVFSGEIGWIFHLFFAFLHPGIQINHQTKSILIWKKNCQIRHAHGITDTVLLIIDFFGHHFDFTSTETVPN